MRSLNHQNFLAPNDKSILYNEEYRIYADAHWMARMITTHGAKYCGRQYALFHYGGISTRPSMRQALNNLRIDYFFWARLKLLYKALFLLIGLEFINKSILRKGYQ
jgi:hypothetical protein